LPGRTVETIKFSARTGDVPAEIITEDLSNISLRYYAFMNLPQDRYELSA
jgi:hypothetical protein